MLTEALNGYAEFNFKKSFFGYPQYGKSTNKFETKNNSTVSLPFATLNEKKLNVILQDFETDRIRIKKGFITLRLKRGKYRIYKFPRFEQFVIYNGNG